MFVTISTDILLNFLNYSVLLLTYNWSCYHWTPYRHIYSPGFRSPARLCFHHFPAFFSPCVYLYGFWLSFVTCFFPFLPAWICLCQTDLPCMTTWFTSKDLVSCFESLICKETSHTNYPYRPTNTIGLNMCVSLYNVCRDICDFQLDCFI